MYKKEAEVKARNTDMLLHSRLDNINAVLASTREAQKQYLLNSFYSTLLTRRRNKSSINDFSFLNIKPKVVDVRKKSSSSLDNKKNVVVSNKVNSEKLCLEIQMNIAGKVINDQIPVDIFKELMKSRDSDGTAVVVTTR